MASVKLSEKLYYGVNPSFHVDHIVDLTENEAKRSFGGLRPLAALHAGGLRPLEEYPTFSGIDYISFPIKDCTAPSLDYLTKIVDTILSLDGTVYIACKGGHGRSGMIAACVIGKQEGLTGNQALSLVDKKWHSQRDMSYLSQKIQKMGERSREAGGALPPSRAELGGAKLPSSTSPQTKAQKEIVKIFLKKPSNNGIQIVFFYDPKQEYGIYSNFYPLKNGLTIDGEKWVSTEAYFQAMKFRGSGASPRQLEYSNLIREADSPMKVKMLGTQRKNMRFGKKWKLNKKTDERIVNDLVDQYADVKMRSDWESVKVAVMTKALCEKFEQYPLLRSMLVSLPDNTYLVEHTNRDKVWGDGGDSGTGEKGKNYLGKILTALGFVLRHQSCESMSADLRNMIKIN